MSRSRRIYSPTITPVSARRPSHLPRAFATCAWWKSRQHRQNWKRESWAGRKGRLGSGRGPQHAGEPAKLSAWCAGNAAGAVVMIWLGGRWCSAPAPAGCLSPQIQSWKPCTSGARDARQPPGGRPRDTAARSPSAGRIKAASAGLANSPATVQRCTHHGLCSRDLLRNKRRSPTTLYERSGRHGEDPRRGDLPPGTNITHRTQACAANGTVPFSKL